MRFGNFTCICIVLTMMNGLLPAQDFIVRTDDSTGETAVDYIERLVTVKGLGASGDEQKSMANRRIWALNEARKNCYTLAAVVVGDISVYGSTMLEAGRIKSDNIELHIQNYIRGITGLKEEVEVFSDGSVLAYVTMTIRFDGNRGLNNLLYNYLFDNPRSTAVTRADSGIAAEGPVYTGIVFDTGGLDLVPSIAPRVYDESGNVVYGPELFSREYALRYGIVGYTRDLLNVTDRVGDNPFGIKAAALREDDRSSLIISNDDAKRLLEIDRRSGLLGLCKVAFRIR